MGNGVHETRLHDRKQRLVQIHAFKAADSATVSRFDYAPNGNRVKANSQVGLRAYSYGEENRLILEGKTSEAAISLTPGSLAVDSTALATPEPHLRPRKLSSPGPAAGY